MPGARCTRGLVCNSAREVTHTSIQVQSEHSGIPCAMVLRLMARSPWRRIPLASIAGELAALEARSGFANLRRLDTSHGCQDHTVLPYASAPFVLRAVRSLTDKPPCNHARARRCRVHHIPSRVRDDRDTPLLPGWMAERIAVICPTAIAECFFGWGWTGRISLIWFRKLGWARRAKIPN